MVMVSETRYGTSVVCRGTRGSDDAFCCGRLK